MLRVLLSARWVGWTVVLVCALVVCGAMTWWQVVRLESPGGSLLNAGYALQWPLFGLFFLFLWARMLHAEATTTPPDHTPDRTDDPAPYGPDDAVGSPRPVRGPAPVRPVASSSPFGPRPAGAVVSRESPARGSARARHNAILAALAENDSPPDTSVRAPTSTPGSASAPISEERS